MASSSAAQGSAPTPTPPSALAHLAASLDASQSDIPSFLNHLLAPLLPPSFPAYTTPQPPSLGPIDKSLNELLTRLSLLSQDTSSAVEQSIHDVSRTVPRLAYDLQFMRESANGLQTSLSMVQDRVARQTDLSPGQLSATGPGHAQGARTHQSLERLTHLDKLKDRLESARDILREAESWSTLEAELTSLVANAEYAKAGQRLHEADRSMVVFQNTPAEYEDRKRLLVSLQNQLETSVSAALGESLAGGDTQACARFWEVFVDMDREDEFRGYYFKAKRGRVLEAWQGASILEASTSSSTPTPFSTFLATFYDTVMEVVTKEADQIPMIFPPQSSPSILASFIQTTFDALDPSFSTRISSMAEYHGREALPETIRAYRATQQLAVGIQTLLDRMTFNTQGGLLSGSAGVVSPVTAGPTSPSHHPTSNPSPSSGRTPSKKMSISRRFSRAPTSGPQPVGTGWETTLYEPFLDLQSTYATLERRYLEHVLRTNPTLEIRPTHGKDVARALTDRSVVAFGCADEAIARCAALTHGYGSSGLVSALDVFLSTFVELQQTAVLDQIKATTGSAKTRERDELDLDGLDYSTDDWGSFQAGLHILESCKEIHGRLDGFETKLDGAIRGVAKVLKATPRDGYDPASTTWGAILLLQQSTLNSADLHGLVAGPALPILPITSNQLATFTRSSQLHLQSIVLSPLISQLDVYPTLGVWTKPDKAPRKGELQVPTFSLSPTDVISRVSEGLLDLLRVFEVWSGESGLGWSLATLPYVDLPSVSDDAGVLPAETVLATWISSLAMSLLAHLTSTTLPSIRTLTSGGQAQLKTDLAYLANAVGALDVQWEDLSRWERAVSLDESAWRREMRELRERPEGDKERDVVRKPQLGSDSLARPAADMSLPSTDPSKHPDPGRPYRPRISSRTRLVSGSKSTDPSAMQRVSGAVLSLNPWGAGWDSTQRRRLAVFVSCVVVGLSSGSNYVYSAYAPQLATQLVASSTIGNVIGLAGNLGVYLTGPLWGKMVDARGPKVALLLGGLCCLVGYTTVHAFYTGGLSLRPPTAPSSEPPSTPRLSLLLLAMFLTGCGGSSGLTAGVNAVAKSFPDSTRASATGTVLAGFGLSAFLFSSLGHTIYKGDAGGLLVLLAIGTGVPMILGSVFISPVPPDQDTSRSIGYNRLDQGDTGPHNPQVEILIQEADRYEIDDGDGVMSRSNSLELVRSRSPMARGRHGGRPQDGPHAHFIGRDGDDRHKQPPGHSRSPSVASLPPTMLAHTPMDLFRSTDFWILFWILALLCGVGLMYINNAGTVALALGRQGMREYDRRRVAGYQAKQVGLIWFLPVVCILFIISQLAALHTTQVQSLWMVSSLLGLAYGSLFNVLPMLVLEWFGMKHFSQNWGWTAVAPVIGSNAFNLLFGRVYDAHTIGKIGTSIGERPSSPSPSGSLIATIRATSRVAKQAGGAIPDDGTHDCLVGEECYNAAFTVSTLGTVLALVLSVWAGLRRERSSRARRAAILAGRAEPGSDDEEV